MDQVPVASVTLGVLMNTLRGELVEARLVTAQLATENRGVRQRSLSTQRCRASVGKAIGNHTHVPTLVLPQPELNRTSVEVHQTPRAL